MANDPQPGLRSKAGTAYPLKVACAVCGEVGGHSLAMCPVWLKEQLLKMLWNHAAFGAECGKATNV